MTLNDSADLLDVNVWVALSKKAHPDHRVVLSAWTALFHPAFCRVTQMGYLRLLCNPHVMGGDVCTMESAWKTYEDLRRSETADFTTEPSQLDVTWKKLSARRGFTYNRWTDTYLAAFAIAGGLRLVTLDHGFRNFSGLNVLILESDP